MVPILAGVPFGTGFLRIFTFVFEFLCESSSSSVPPFPLDTPTTKPRIRIHSYIIYAASVMVANGVLRSTFGAVFPLSTTYRYLNIHAYQNCLVSRAPLYGCYFHAEHPDMPTGCKDLWYTLGLGCAGLHRSLSQQPNSCQSFTANLCAKYHDIFFFFFFWAATNAATIIRPKPPLPPATAI